MPGPSQAEASAADCGRLFPVSSTTELRPQPSPLFGRDCPLLLRARGAEGHCPAFVGGRSSLSLATSIGTFAEFPAETAK